MQSSTTTIRLELRSEDEYLTGHATGGGGARREFTGWIGLLAAIDELVSGGSVTTTYQEECMSIEIAPASVIRPGEDGFEQGRQAFNLTVDQRPELIAYPADEREVIALVRQARAQGLRVAPQRTGHNAGPIDWERPAMLLRTDAMQGVEIDAAGRRARVRAGAMWMDLVDDASEMGLAALHGSARDIGIAGYSLGGGVGWYARKHGLQTNAVTAIELVTADGELVRADHDNEPELFWALRGGGGNFGVVTALEFDLFPIAEVFAGMLLFPIERADEVLHAWHEWTAAGLPDEVTSVGSLLSVPDIDGVPDMVRGRSFARVEAAYLGTEADGAELMRPLRELGAEIDTFAMVPPVALSYLHMDPDTPIPYAGTSRMLGDLSAGAIDDLLAAAGPGSGSQLLMAELRHLGGALARPAPHHGARSTLDGSYLMFGAGLVMAPEQAPSVEADCARLSDALAPYDSGSAYLNFVEEEDFDVSRAFSAESWERLRRVKDDLDPDGLFLANHEIR
jgi:FAD/FMN-containing dehydrogenase